jgi:uncharacterized membrane protein (DUF373 family)
LLTSAVVPHETKPPVSRVWIARIFTLVEDIVYVGLGLLLAVSALALLVDGTYSFAHTIASGTLADHIINLLDRILLILLVVELLYTVQVSFREHTIAPEPFLLVGVIAAIRRVLVLTAQIGHTPEPNAAGFEAFMTELGILTVLILVLTLSLMLLRKAPVAAKRVES